MTRYSPERKEAVLSKLLPPYNLTVSELARQEGISAATLYTWRSQAKLEGRPVPGKTTTTENWSAEAKLATGEYPAQDVGSERHTCLLYRRSRTRHLLQV